MSCPGCKDCPYKDDDVECYDACCFGYCPADDEYEDIGSATVREMREQNGDY